MCTQRNREPARQVAARRGRRFSGEPGRSGLPAGRRGRIERRPAYAVGPAAATSAGTVARYLAKLAEKRAASALAWSS